MRLQIARPLCLALLIAAPALAQKSAPRIATMYGRVLTDSTERPIIGADIVVADDQITATTDSAGRFRLPAISAGKHLVSVRRLGFKPIEAAITFAPGDTLEGDFILSKSLQRLERVVIRTTALSPKMLGFDDRRRMGFGNFIGPDELAKMQNRTMSDLLRLVPGPAVHRSNNSGMAWVANGRGSTSTGGYTVDRSDRMRGAPTSQCYSTVYLDGAAVFSALPGELLFDINSVPSDVVAGIEFYGGAGAIPPQFPAKRNTCGVLVIWTKP